MERVLIVAKTKMSNGVCIGGLALSTNRNVRLLTSNGSKQPANTKFDVGQIWDVDFQSPEVIKPPHVEDVEVHNVKYIGQQMHLCDFLMERIKPWQGGVEQLFNGYLTSERESCYVPEYITPPIMSTGFWLPNEALERAKNPQYYVSRITALIDDEYGVHDERIYIRYVGFSPPLSLIPAETLVRVSLARWWKSPSATEQRCYLQLSGWYV